LKEIIIRTNRPLKCRVKRDIIAKALVSARRDGIPSPHRQADRNRAKKSDFLRNDVEFQGGAMPLGATRADGH
jgi:hypothetical protein